jgi:DNA-binding LacI/PurR family transcriptional regulator
VSAGGRPTLEVVAARAGVSRATASRVLRGSSDVSDSARERVLQAARDVSYSVNLAARALVTRRTDSIAFLVAESEDRTFHDPYFHGVLRGAQAAAAEAGMQIVFVIASTPEQTARFTRFVRGGHVDGVLLVSLHGDDALPLALEEHGVPTVLNGRPFGCGRALFSVDSDNLGGARAATQHLIERGARRIATITGPLDMTAAQDRLAGARAAAAAAGLALPDTAVRTGDFSVEGGAAATARLLDSDPDIDGIVAASDLMAVGALRVLAERGRRVPDDVRVVGFDDVGEAALATPPLTTVRQPLEALGRTMTEVLLARVLGQDAPREQVLPTTLVRRAST